MAACPICGTDAGLESGRCPSCGAWLAGKRVYGAPVMAIIFFSFVCAASFAAGIYSILNPAMLGPFLGFVPLILGWGCLWVIIFHYRPLLKEAGEIETIGPYER